MEKLSKFKRFYNKIYYNLFIENTNKKIDFKFPNNLKRWDLVKEIIKKKKNIKNTYKLNEKMNNYSLK